MKASALETLGTKRFEELWEEGRNMSLDQAVAEARTAAG